MKFKKIIPVLFMAICTSLAMPVFAKNDAPVNPLEQTVKTEQAQQLLSRLKEIQDMNKSDLTSSEKKQLRKELKQMKRQVERDRRNGVYLSVGGIIIVILLLILILR